MSDMRGVGPNWLCGIVMPDYGLIERYAHVHDIGDSCDGVHAHPKR